MFTELSVPCSCEAPKIPFAELLQGIAGSLESCPLTETGWGNGIVFDELGIAVSVTLDDDEHLTAARVQVSDGARIGHVSEVFKTFITLGWWASSTRTNPTIHHPSISKTARFLTGDGTFCGHGRIE